jgi:cellulose synthase/poly-beta-1,6-N-acetylglucosamine synthase-like glycosyltransferase
MITLFIPWNIYEGFESPLGHGLGSLAAGISGLYMARWCLVQGLAFIAHDRMRFTRRAENLRLQVPAPLVSILVPAYNESGTITSAVASLMSLAYPNYEIIIVDDGSSDDTYAKAKPHEGNHGKCAVKVFRKPNGGKWSALNFAYERSRGEFLLCVDADSRLGSDALTWLVIRLQQDENVWAACGQVTIRNRKRLLARFQALEYLIANGGLRTAFSSLGTVTVVPGPIGLYRREALERVTASSVRASRDAREGDVFGPLSDETFAEDFQLSLTVLALGGRVIYEPRAFAYTKCPDRIESLLNQRYRWIRGTLQVFRIYVRSLRAVAHVNHRRLDPVMMLFYPFDIYFAPILNFVFLSSLFLAVGFAETVGTALNVIGAIGLLQILTATIMILAQDDELSLVPLAVVIDLYQSLLINSGWVIAIFDELRGTRMRWS